jgi:hypothetical protein
MAIESVRRTRSYVRKWIIDCANGSMETYPLKRHEADEVARWCDHNHPDCRPHIVQSRETRTWAERK